MTKAPTPSTSIILASTSPRRIEFLTSLGIPFRSLSPDIVETPRPGESPRALVLRLAREKALAILPTLPSGSIPDAIIAADTIVVLPSRRKILGKPTDARDAARMLKLIQGTTHWVYTAYAIWSKGRVRVRVVRTSVRMRSLSRAQIETYIATGEPLDKAGAYGAQGIGMSLIEEIRGSYTSVVGLPLSQLITDLIDLRVLSDISPVTCSSPKSRTAFKR